MIFLRTAHHCFCLGLSHMQSGVVYCTHEFYESNIHTKGGDEIMIYLGLRDLKRIDEAVRYKIESVRFPKERIEMYARHQFFGPDDVALVKTRERVFFIPGKIMPVGCPA